MTEHWPADPIAAAESAPLAKITRSLIEQYAREAAFGFLPPLCPSLASSLTSPAQLMTGAHLVRGAIRSDPLLAGQALAAAGAIRRQEGLDPVKSLKEATDVLGAQGCRTVMQASAQAITPVPAILRESAERLAAHSLAVASRARLLARRRGLPEDQAFTAGLLHDVGRALLLHAMVRMCKLPSVFSGLVATGVEPMLDHPRATAMGRDLARGWMLTPELEQAIGIQSRGDQPLGPVAQIVHSAESAVQAGINQHALAGGNTAAIREVLVASPGYYGEAKA